MEITSTILIILTSIHTDVKIKINTKNVKIEININIKKNSLKIILLFIQIIFFILSFIGIWHFIKTHAPPFYFG